MKWLDEYKRSLKMVEVEEVLDMVLYRPLAFLFVKSILRTSITPNQITVVSMLFGIAGAVAIGLGTAQAALLAALLLIIYDVLDCSDGQLARLKKNGTKAGRILDGVADYIVNVAMYFGIAIGYAWQSDNPLLWWLLTAAAGGSNMLHSILVDYYRNRFLDVVLQRPGTFDDDLEDFRQEYERLKAARQGAFDRLIIRVYLGYSRFQGGLARGERAQEAITNTSPERFLRANRRVMQAWLLVGPTSQLTFVVIAALFHRFDLYLPLLVLVGNLWVLLVYLVQKRVDHSLTLEQQS